MNFLRQLPIKRKLTLITMLTSGLALVVACLALASYEQINIRRRLINDLATTAAMTGVNSTAGLTFNDANAVEQTLKSLATQPRIVRACVYGKEGRPFAEYQRATESRSLLAPPARAEGHRFTTISLELFQPISLDGEVIGTIFLESDLQEIRASLWRFVIVLIVLLVACSFVALLVAARLQRIISRPIADLARTAARVADERDYSVRAVKESDDELGKLMDGFNHMLTQIQAQDEALQKSHLELERRVQERTSQLADSLSLTRATLEATADGILVADGHGRVTSFNERFLVIWNIPRAIGHEGQETPMLEIAMSQLKEPEAFLTKVQALYADLEAESFDVLEFHDGRVFEQFSRPQRIGDVSVGRVWSFRDITERLRSEETLRRTEELYRQAISCAGAVPYGFDFKTRRYLFMGAGIQQMIGYAPHELSGIFWKQITQKSVMLGEAAGMDKAAAAEAVSQGKIRHWHCDMLVTTRSGEARWITDISVLNVDETGRPVGSMGMLQDITARKNAEAELARTHQRLLETSRQAGMAEVATGVLHNVGNVLNSVNVAATCISDQVHKSKAPNLARVAGMLRENQAQLTEYITHDAKGRQLLPYLTQLAEHIAGEQATILKETAELQKHIEHIKDIVAMQQSFAKFSGLAEPVKVADLLDDALRMHQSALQRHGIKVIKDYKDAPVITVEKHKALQILINLMRNAKQACEVVDQDDKRITLRVLAEAEHVAISVGDNGVGIPAENLTRIFSHGFTTKKNGHGFGLHSGALAAQEMGGSLRVASAGMGQGAVFILELPTTPARRSA